MRSEWVRGRHIVIANWRDIDHPQAGGAELYCFEVAKRLRSLGARVTVLTARSSSLPTVIERDGVRVIRRGGRFTVYARVMLWLWRHRGEVDAVVDCQNGIPFFTPLALGSRIPVLLLVHHVHQEQFAYHFGRRLAVVGRFLEGPASRAVYRSRAIVAVSPSTRSEVRSKLGLQGPIFIVPNGLPGRAEASPISRRSQPSIVVVGRLVPQKRLEVLLEAVAGLGARWPSLTIDVVGDGPEVPFLRQTAADLGIAASVSFHGRVDDAVRDRLLQSAWLTVNPSMREGWGLSVLEANRLGVPALAFDVPGLRDAVRHGITGWLVEPGESLAEALDSALTTLDDPDAARGYARGARTWAANFSWERTGDRIARLMAAEAGRVALRSPNRETTDLVTRIEIDGDANTFDAVAAGGRLDDEWRLDDSGISGLLYGSDEEGAQRALARLGLSPAKIALADSRDLLGRAGPPPIYGVSDPPSVVRQSHGGVGVR